MRHWPSHIATTAFELGLDKSPGRVLIGLEDSGVPDLDVLGRNVSRLLHLICSLPERFFENDLRKMAGYIGFGAAEIEILMCFPEKICFDVFARADVIEAHDGWKVIEINVGSSVGGMAKASLPRLSGEIQAGDVLQAWADKCVSSWGMRGKRVVFVADSRIVEGIKTPLTVFATEIARAASCEIEILGANELRWDGDSVVDKKGRVDFIICRFGEEQVLKNVEEFWPIMKGMQDGKVSCPMGPIYKLISNKGIFAFLWELCESNRLTQDEADLVRSMIPPTIWLDANSLQQIKQDRVSFVIKPIDGLAGKDVLCGKEYSQIEWDEVLRRIVDKAPRSFVVQNYVESVFRNVALADETGSLSMERCRIVWGIYIFGDDYLGTYLRAKPIGASAVINAANGASSGPLPSDFRD